jgi:transcriptional regulator with XRE-family HTH domain
MKNELRQKREELNLTLQDVADYVGVSAGTVSRWETGNINNMKRHAEITIDKGLFKIIRYT